MKNAIIVYGDWELVILTTPDGVEHELHSMQEYRDFVDQWDFEHSESYNYIASDDQFADMGTRNGTPYATDEEFLEARKNSSVHGKIQ